MSFKAFCLCLLILLLGTFIYFKFETLGDEHTAFNQTTRYELGKHLLLRTVMALHQDGDARAEYLLGSGAIDIEVAQSPAHGLPDEVVQSFAAQVKAVTGRPTKIYNVDPVPTGNLSRADIEHITQVDKKQFNIGDSVILVIYADDFAATSEEVGQTVEEFGMVLSDDQLRSLTEDYPAALPQYQESTLLHEFGHQLGLGHNVEQGCIMNPSIQIAHAPLLFSNFYTPTSFCSFELEKLKQIKAGL